MSGSDKIQFRGRAEKEALEAVDELRIGGINVSEIAREGVKELLRRSLSDEERMNVHQLYQQGEISEEAAQVLIGDGLEEIERERKAFSSAMELDTEGMLQG